MSTRLTKLRVRCSKARREIRRLAASRRRGYLLEVRCQSRVYVRDGNLHVVRVERGSLLVDRRGRHVDDARIERLMNDIGNYCSALMREDADASA